VQNPEKFDYNQPSLDALAGIYVEVTDSPVETPATQFNGAPGGTILPTEVERLFGLTMTVDDESPADQPGRTRHLG
jgi:hypothetical protein